jgi:hypothetical protein
METVEPFGIGVPLEIKPLTERATDVQRRMENILSLAESIYSELYCPIPCKDEDGNKPRYSMEETISQMEYTVSQIEDCLVDTLKRLRG